MKKRRIIWIVWTIVALGLSACTEKPQSIGQNSREDQQAFKGAAGPFMAAGWKPGEKASWEQQLKTRQQGQNEYNRIY